MSALLQLQAVSAGYGAARVLQGIDLSLEAGDALALLGRNGAGKTTLLLTILGLTARHAGRLYFDGRDITQLPSQARAKAGIGWVPQERGIFPSLSVEENITAAARPGPWTLGRIYSLFPRLAERRANSGGQLSGGEQQMLAMGRALALNPRLLLLDEPLEGLAPVIAEELLAAIAGIARDGLAVILVEQKARKILPMTSAAVILERGAVAHYGPSAAVAADDGVLHRFLGLAR